MQSIKQIKKIKLIKTSLRCMLLLTLFSFLPSNLLAYGSFSCPMGKQAACLDYGDKVCPSYGKCVDDDAICFSSFTCDYKGFICKSKFDDLADDLAYEYEKLVDKYNETVNKYNKTVEVIEEYEDQRTCVEYASTLEEAKNCI